MEEVCGSDFSCLILLPHGLSTGDLPCIQETGRGAGETVTLTGPEPMKGWQCSVVGHSERRWDQRAVCEKFRMPCPSPSPSHQEELSVKPLGEGPPVRLGEQFSWGVVGERGLGQNGNDLKK